MANYNPNNLAHGNEDATIGSTVYTVTSFSVDRPTVEIDFQTSSGAHLDTALEDGKPTASMTIECQDKIASKPAMYTTFTYPAGGDTYVIKQIAEARTNGSATTWTLSLNIA